MTFLRRGSLILVTLTDHAAITHRKPGAYVASTTLIIGVVRMVLSAILAPKFEYVDANLPTFP
jgi:hypothetical protein